MMHCWQSWRVIWEPSLRLRVSAGGNVEEDGIIIGLGSGASNSAMLNALDAAASVGGAFAGGIVVAELEVTAEGASSFVALGGIESVDNVLSTVYIYGDLRTRQHKSISPLLLRLCPED